MTILHHRNQLLPEAKSVLLHDLVGCVETRSQEMMEKAFSRADSARSALEQETWLAIHQIFRRRGEQVAQSLHVRLARLVDRGLQTAYDSYRPTLSALHRSPLSLIDDGMLENGLLVGSMADRLRNESADELRNLNIRIALLYRTHEVRERENPFRPWLIARAVSDTAEEMGVRSFAVPQLSQQINDCVSDTIEGAYANINRMFARHGVAAELALKVRKAPEKVRKPEGRQAEPVSMPVSPQFEELLRTFGHWSVRPVTVGGMPQGGGGPSPGQLREWLDSRDFDCLCEAVRQYAVCGSPAEGTAASGGAAGWLGGMRQIGSRLRSLLGAGSGAYRGFSAQPSAGLPPRTVTVALTDSIGSLQQQSLHEEQWFDDQGALRNLILEHRAQWSQQTTVQEEQMTLDVVAMLFEFILRDSEVPARVRVELARLQLLILRIALRDPNLLTRRGHPVRLLVNRFASIAGSHKEIDPGFELVSAKIRQLVDTLLHDTEDAPERFLPLFARLLDEFDDFVAAELRSRNERVDRVASAFEQVPGRIHRYQRVLAQMREALAGQEIDARLREFLLKSWVQVIESAEDMEASLALRFRKFVPALLWSLAPRQNETERQMLMSTLPGLVTTLREGLTLIAWPETKQKEILDWLFIIHTRAMFPAEGGEVTEPPVVARAPEIEPFEPLLANAAMPAPSQPEAERPAAEEALYDTALRRMGDTLHTLDDSQAERLAAEAGPAPAGLPDDAALDEEIDARLHRGVMVELLIGREPSLARLSWMSHDRDHLLLALDGDRPPVTMTLRAFRRLFQHQRVRFAETEPLVERALRSLLDSAERLGGGVPAAAADG